MAEVAEVWRRGSVIGSWLVDLTAAALAESPDLSDYAGRVSDSGEGRWTVIAGIEEGVPASVIACRTQRTFRVPRSGQLHRQGALRHARRVRRPRREAGQGELKLCITSLEVHDDSAAVAAAAADHVAAARERTQWSVTVRFHFAVSGGHTPWAMFAVLAEREVPWEKVVIYQVDERVAPPADPDRNLGHLMDALAGAPATVVPMPVEDPDPAEVAAQLRGRPSERPSTWCTSDSAPMATPPRWCRATRVLEVTDKLVAPTRGSTRVVTA